MVCTAAPGCCDAASHSVPFLCFKLKIVAAAGQLGCRATCQIPSTEATLYSLADVSCNACGCCRALDAAKPQVMVQWCSRLCRRWSIVGTMAVSISYSTCAVMVAFPVALSLRLPHCASCLSCRARWRQCSRPCRSVWRMQWLMPRRSRPRFGSRARRMCTSALAWWPSILGWPS